MNKKKLIFLLPLLILPSLTSCSDKAREEIEISRAEFAQDFFLYTHAYTEVMNVVVQYCSYSTFLIFEGDYDFQHNVSFTYKEGLWGPAEFETSEYVPEIADKLNRFTFHNACIDAEGFFPGYEVKFFGQRDLRKNPNVPSYIWGDFIQYKKEEDGKKITYSVFFDDYGMLSALHQVVKSGAKKVTTSWYVSHKDS